LGHVTLSNRSLVPEIWVPAAVHDVRFAVRALMRRPVYAAMATLTLALGIAAATTMYSVVDGVLLKPLPYVDADRLTMVFRTFPKWRDQEALRSRWESIWFSYPAFRDWRSRQTAFANVAAWTNATRTLASADGAEQVAVVRATATLLDVLGVRPALGRYFLAGEDGPPGARVAIISYDAWTARFGGRRDVIGTVITLDGDPYAIVGVLPAGVDLTNRGRPQPIWIPAGGAPSDARAGSTEYLALGRLRSGVSLSQALDETRRLVAESSPPDPVGARVVSWRDELTRTSQRPLFLLLGASVVLLLLACVNTSTLMLGEASSRSGEFATRIALGAGRARVARQVMIEGLVVSTGAVVLGTLAASAAMRLLVALAPANIPRLAQAQVDVRVLAAACVAGVASAMLASLAPGIALGSVSPSDLLGGGRSTRRGEQWTLRGLISAQIALSCLLFVGAALLGQTVRRLDAVDPGFQSDHLTLIGLGITGSRYTANGLATTAFFDQVAQRLSAIPGVERAAVGSAAPFSGGGSSSGIVVEGQSLPAGVTTIDARRSHVLPGFIETLGLRLLSGRTIDDHDQRGGVPVAVVNATMAHRFWPSGSAIGKRVRFNDQWLTIVGVVSDVKHSALSDTTRITLYLPARQQDTPYLTVVLRARLNAEQLMPAVRRTVASLDPAVPVTRVDAVPELVSQSFAGERFRAVLIAIFAALAGALAVIGIYGVTARTVVRQRREIGIRMALGSPPWRVSALLVSRTGAAVALGVAVGLAGAAATAKVLSPYLFGTDALDPLLYAGSATLLAITAFAAACLPTRSASRTDPAIVLRDTR
jgi:predicted permease